MAVPSSLSLRFPTFTPIAPSATPHHPYPFLPLNKQSISFKLSRSHRYRVINAIEEGQQGNQIEKEEEKLIEIPSSSSSPPSPPVELKDRESDKEGGDLWSGVAEEIREIEWPAFGKVLGITGVVLGVISGSSVVLLTVNAILTELSDRVFVGRGVQDFFG